MSGGMWDVTDLGPAPVARTTRPKPVVLPPLRQQPSPNHSDRYTPVDLVVIHSTISPPTAAGYRGSCDWLCNPQAQVSAHVVLAGDGSEASQLVPWDKKAWACCDFNSRSDNLELVGPPHSLRQLNVAARIVAFRLHKRGLPARWAKGGIGAGYTRHIDLGAAGGNHHDPILTPARWLYLRLRIRYELRRGGFAKEWGTGDA